MVDNKTHWVYKMVLLNKIIIVLLIILRGEFKGSGAEIGCRDDYLTIHVRNNRNLLNPFKKGSPNVATGKCVWCLQNDGADDVTVRLEVQSCQSLYGYSTGVFVIHSHQNGCNSRPADGVALGKFEHELTGTNPHKSVLLPRAGSLTVTFIGTNEHRMSLSVSSGTGISFHDGDHGAANISSFVSLPIGNISRIHQVTKSLINLRLPRELLESVIATDYKWLSGCRSDQAQMRLLLLGTVNHTMMPVLVTNSIGGSSDNEVNPPEPEGSAGEFVQLLIVRSASGAPSIGAVKRIGPDEAAQLPVLTVEAGDAGIGLCGGNGSFIGGVICIEFRQPAELKEEMPSEGWKITMGIIAAVIALAVAVLLYLLWKHGHLTKLYRATAGYCSCCQKRKTTGAATANGDESARERLNGESEERF